MKKLIPALLFSALLTTVHAMEYKEVEGWLKLPEGKTQLGNMHGDIAVSSAGDIYVSMLDAKGGLLVFGADGKYLRQVPDAPNDFHGFVIRKEKDGEFIYGARLSGQTILKMTLDGKVVMTIPPTDVPDEFKNKGKDGKGVMRLTGMDIAPNGDLYVTDGYASDYVHHFDHNGKYLNSFGGKKPPFSLKTLHKIAIDTRFTPPRIIGADRENRRVVHLSLDGEFIGVVAQDLLRPAAVAIQGDYAVIGEIAGEISILDKAGKVVARFGLNTNADEVANNKTPVEKWRPGFVTAPHGVAFDAHGNVYVAEYSVFGRVHRFDRQ